MQLLTAYYGHIRLALRIPGNKDLKIPHMDMFTPLES